MRRTPAARRRGSRSEPSRPPPCARAPRSGRSRGSHSRTRSCAVRGGSRRASAGRSTTCAPRRVTAGCSSRRWSRARSVVASSASGGRRAALRPGLPRRAPRGERGRDPRGARRESLPLHWLPENHRGRCHRGPRALRREDNTMSTGPRVVGQRLPRLDAPGKVTGTAVYAADFALPGMLHGKVLRSREAHARLLGVDAARARTLPGVRAVITAADVPDVRYGGALKDETVFARDKVRYVGQPVAAVAATTRGAAEAALAATDVPYEPLPAVFDVEAALAPGAPLIHEAWPTYTAIPILHREGNVCNRARIAGRPVKIVTTCEEELTAAYPRQSTRVELKTGVTRDGRITAKAGRIWFDTGAFAGSGPGVASVATLVLAGPYRIPNLLIEGYAVYTNKTNCGSFRAPSGPQA